MNCVRLARCVWHNDGISNILRANKMGMPDGGNVPDPTEPLSIRGCERAPIRHANCCETHINSNNNFKMIFARQFSDSSGGGAGDASSI